MRNSRACFTSESSFISPPLSLFDNCLVNEADSHLARDLGHRGCDTGVHRVKGVQAVVGLCRANCRNMLQIVEDIF